MSARWFLPSLFLLFSCSAPDTTGIKLIGHGGLGPDGEHPMDSREALMGALASGLDGVEIDVQLTADSVLVAFHDAELGCPPDDPRPIHSFTWSELKGCPTTTDADHAYPIVRLDSLLLQAAAEYPLAEFTLDLKLNTKGEWWPYLHAFSGALIALNERPEVDGRILLECQTADVLRLLHERAPEIPTYLYATDPASAVGQAIELGCAGITMDHRTISAEVVAAAKQHGLGITIFGVEGRPALRSAVEKGPDRIQIDR